MVDGFGYFKKKVIAKTIQRNPFFIKEIASLPLQ